MLFSSEFYCTSTNDGDIIWIMHVAACFSDRYIFSHDAYFSFY